MARIFLSYDRDDAPRAKPLAAALTKAGHSVWWDDLIRGGSQYSKEIEQALNSCDAVIVLWSARSVESAWVRDEAAAGRDRGCLLPVLLDGSEPPLGFRQFQNIDLSRWNGRGKPAELRQLLDAIPRTGGEKVSTPAEATPVARRPPRSGLAWLAIAGVAILIVSYAAFRFLQRPGSSAVPAVAVVGADNGPAARGLARDVLVDLGGLEGPASRSFRLTDDAGQNADLIVEIAASMLSQKPQASLVLRTAGDRSLLWSRQFQRSEGSFADLRPEVVNSAALILGCAQDGLSADQTLDTEILKKYLGGCWQLVGPDGTDFNRLAATFLDVTRRAPRFEDGWAGLLYAESQLVPGITGQQGSSLRRALHDHIDQARRVNPSLPEISLAEAAFVRPTDVAGRIRLIGEAAKHGPEDALALVEQAYEWTAVGRVTDAVRTAYSAVQLDPYSPAVRDAHVYALQQAGQLDLARSETEEVARIWPNAAQLWFMRIRSGDPATVLKLTQSSPSWQDTQVEQAAIAAQRARMDPTQQAVGNAIQQSHSVMLKWMNSWPEAVGRHLWTLATFHRTEEIFQTMNGLKGRPDLTPYIRTEIFAPAFRDFWRDPRSMRVAAQLGVLQYWRTSGNWPDFCYEADFPYDCKGEAAKLPG